MTTTAAESTLTAPVSRPMGVHLLVEGEGAPFATLDDPDAVRKAVLAAVESCGATLLEVSAHHFDPQGVTVVATLSESHLAIHTWPERGEFAADLFHCAAFDADSVVTQLVEGLQAERWQARTIRRGGSVPPVPPPGVSG